MRSLRARISSPTLTPASYAGVPRLTPVTVSRPAWTSVSAPSQAAGSSCGSPSFFSASGAKRRPYQSRASE